MSANRKVRFCEVGIVYLWCRQTLDHGAAAFADWCAEVGPQLHHGAEVLVFVAAIPWMPKSMYCPPTV